MKKVIRLTEEDLTKIVRRVINETEMEEGIFDTILKGLKSGKSGLKTVAKTEIPLINQLSYDITRIIEKLPKTIKVGPKLEGLFSRNKFKIQNMDGAVKRMSNEIPSLGIAKFYSDRIAKTIQTTKGSPIELKKMYQEANMLKKELENVKSQLQKPKEGGILNKNKNFSVEVEKWYNTLNNEIASVTSFIDDFNSLIK